MTALKRLIVMKEGEMLLQFVFQNRGNKIENCEHLIEIVGDGEGKGELILAKYLFQVRSLSRLNKTVTFPVFPFHIGTDSFPSLQTTISERGISNISTDTVNTYK